MAKEIGDIAQFRAISRRLKLYGLDLEEIDEDVEGMLEGMFGTKVGTSLYQILKMAADNEFVEYMCEKAIDGIES